MSIRMAMILAVTLLSLTACGGGEDTSGGTAGSVKSDQTMRMEGMEGMSDTVAMASGAMMEQMRTHMAMMRGLGADSVAAVMPMHRQMLATMIAQMDREMRAMNMSGDAAWVATIDSLRTDLRTMPEMTPDEVHAAMAAHHARIDRLMEMHRAMMGPMQM